MATRMEQTEALGERGLLGMPISWFQIGWSDELAPGDVKPLRYFGADLVLYRGEDGHAHLMDAHCPHLGAHLGYGGLVRDDCIECPFHGWLWDGEGRNVEIPYADRPNRAQRIRTWELRELNGMLYAWYHPDHKPPSWEPPEFPESLSPVHYAGPETRTTMPNHKVTCQQVMENVVDFAHQQFVHGAAEPSEVLSYEPVGEKFLVWQKMTMGARGRKTFLTDKPIEGRIEIVAYGMGIGTTRFHEQDGAFLCQTQTPIDDYYCDLRTTVFVKMDHPTVLNAPTEEDKYRRARHLMRQTEKDLIIWEHQRYIERAPFAGGETRSYNAFRRWSQQFHTAADLAKEPTSR